MCVQPAFLIGTYNADGTPDFAPITWVSVTCEQGEDYLLVISMYGTKMTKQNVMRTGKLSVNLVSTDMLPLMDYFGSRSCKHGTKDGIAYEWSDGASVHAPILEASRWIYECEVRQTVNTGASDTFFCAIRNVLIDSTFDHVQGASNLMPFDPVIYSGGYHALRERLGAIGDFLPAGFTKQP